MHRHTDRQTDRHAPQTHIILMAVKCFLPPSQMINGRLHEDKYYNLSVCILPATDATAITSMLQLLLHIDTHLHLHTCTPTLNTHTHLYVHTHHQSITHRDSLTSSHTCTPHTHIHTSTLSHTHTHGRYRIPPSSSRIHQPDPSHSPRLQPATGLLHGQ